VKQIQVLSPEKGQFDFIDKLSDITLIVQDWGGLLGLSLLGEYPKDLKGWPS